MNDEWLKKQNKFLDKRCSELRFERDQLKEQIEVQDKALELLRGIQVLQSKDGMWLNIKSGNLDSMTSLRGSGRKGTIVGSAINDWSNRRDELLRTVEPIPSRGE